eukprot:Ihof_evm1s1349 gene=Ihof_evmTU1s1349
MEVLCSFKEYLQYSTNNFGGATMETFMTDNGTKYVNAESDHLLEKNSILHQASVPYHPQQNGISEQLNQTFFTAVCSFLIENRLSARYWDKAVRAAAFTLNVLPSWKTKEIFASSSIKRGADQQVTTLGETDSPTLADVELNAYKKWQYSKSSTKAKSFSKKSLKFEGESKEQLDQKNKTSKYALLIKCSGHRYEKDPSTNPALHTMTQLKATGLNSPRSVASAMNSPQWSDWECVMQTEMK